MADLSDAQKDALKEMGNIGSGNAATALSQLISQLINISVPRVQFVPLEEVANQLGGQEKPVYVIYLDVISKINGTMLTVIDKETAMFLGKSLMSEEDLDPNSEIYESALKEIGSILCGSYLSALSQIVDETFIASVPTMACDMLGALLDAVLAEIGQIAEEVLFIKTELLVSDTKLQCCQLFLPKPEALEHLLSAVGM
ncbi:MAG: chemotaxis protein CheC [PVC group bacterium]|nr:chemotaxis protein CheC [PVC group bacterium]